MAGATTSPTFIFVPGAHCPGSVYRPVTERLSALGYAVIESDHPTITHADQVNKTFLDDAEHVRSQASALMDKGVNVIVVGNSYGGFVVTEAVKGLSEAEREAAGKAGGGKLANMVAFGTLLVRAGKTCDDATSEVGFSHDPDHDIVAAPSPAEAGMIFSDLPEEERLRLGAQFRPQARGAFFTKLTHEGYLHVPTTYIVTEKDRGLDSKIQHQNADGVIASGKARVVKRSIDSDHCPQASRPEELVRILVEAAGRKVE